MEGWSRVEAMTMANKAVSSDSICLREIPVGFETLMVALAGKSSLLDMITGDRALQSGRRDVGETTALGYFRQHVPDVKPSLKIIDYIRTIHSFIHAFIHSFMHSCIHSFIHSFIRFLRVVGSIMTICPSLPASAPLLLCITCCCSLCRCM